MYKRERFGDKIKQIRLSTKPKTTLKRLSQDLGINITMLSDIENNRKKPFAQDVMELFFDYFNLDEKTRNELYDLAADERNDIPMDLNEKIMYSEVGDLARRALRMSDDSDLEEWKKLIHELEKRKDLND